MTDYTLPAQPQSIGRVLDAGMKLFQHAFTRVVVLGIAGQLILIVPSALAVLLGAGASGLAVLFVVFVFLCVVFYLVVYVALIERSWRIASGGDISAGAACRRGLRLLLPFLFGSVLYFIAVVLGFVLLIIPGIYLTLALSLYALTVVTEELGPVAALNRSLKLMRGNWWRSMAVLTVPMIIFLALAFMAEGIPMMAFGMDYTTGEVSVDPGTQLVIQFFSALIGGAAMPLMVTTGLVLYNDLRIRTDGDDIAQQLDALDQVD